MYQVSFEIFDSMKVEIIWVSWQERNKEKGGGEEVLVYPVFVEDIDYNVMSRQKGSKKGGKRKW